MNTNQPMNIEEAKKQVEQRFPFPGYLSGVENSYKTIAATVQRYLKPGQSILDFGSGPCDKTAIVQSLGYHCTAYDDLSDHWHNLEGNKQKIIDFVAGEGIDFRVVDDYSLPFEANSFDMVMLHAVLDHLHDSPRELMNSLVEFIKPGGYLFITLPNAVNIRKRLAVMRGKTNMPSYESYYWYPGSWRGHIREYVRDDLEKLTKYLNMDLVELGGCHTMIGRVPSVIRPIYAGLTAIFPGWRDSWSLVAQKPRDWKPNTTISDEHLQKIMSPVMYVEQ
jgi:SAM-dependent methyltransferase